MEKSWSESAVAVCMPVLASLLLCACSTSPPHHALTEAAPVPVFSDVDDRTARYATSTTMVAQLTQLSTMEDGMLHRHRDCSPSDERFRLVALFGLAPARWEADQRDPVAGAWQIRYAVDRCGASHLYNAVVAAHPEGGPPTVTPFFPGSSLASPRLMGDTYVRAMPIALAKAGDRACPKALVSDVRVDRPVHRVVENGKVFDRVWYESWVFDACGNPVDLFVRFTGTPADGGTDFLISTKPFGSE